jgi:hypothetical protein
MISPIQIQRRQRRYKSKVGRPTPTPPPPGDLNLVSADYVVSPSLSVVLGFDRAIDISGLNGAAIVVDDGDAASESFAATGETEMLDPATVRIGLDYIGDDSDPGIYLNATDESGIVAVGDGGTWPGVTGWVLPDPH